LAINCKWLWRQKAAGICDPFGRFQRGASANRKSRRAFGCKIGPVRQQCGAPKRAAPAFFCRFGCRESQQNGGPAFR
jgi:hypothetical protein